MQNPPEGLTLHLPVSQTSSRALGNMTGGVPPFGLQPEKVQETARLQIHHLEEGPHRSKLRGLPT